MADFKKLLIFLGKKFPKKIGLKYHDYIGKMIGKHLNEVQKILICLDFDETILKQTLDFKPDVIFTHHPLIYGSKKDIFNNFPNKKELVDVLNKHNIPVFSFHTNFDEGNGGMNDALSSLLCLKNVYKPTECPMMRIGYLDKNYKIDDFSRYALEKLNVNYGLLINSGVPNINKVAIMGGAGSGFYKTAINEKCDIYISCDVPHHIRREIVLANFNYLDLPHEIEKAFINRMETLLKEFDDSLIVKTIDHEILPEIVLIK